MKASARVVVDQPVEAVWAYVSNVENLSEWVVGVSDVRPSDDSVTVGSRFASKYTYRGKTFDVDYEVTAYDPPTRLDMASTEGPFPFAGSLRLVAVDGGTEVTNTLDAGSDGLATSVIFAVFGPIVRWMMRRQLAAELEQLTRAIGAGDRPIDADASPAGDGARPPETATETDG